MKQSFLKRFFFPLCIFLVTAFITFTTFKPGTFLTGWDTLHPEFNFSLNFQRLVDGVLREEQGLGAVAGHSHMADLPRVVILWLLHFILPLNMLRYTYVFLCLFIGPLGVYYLIRYLLEKSEARSSKHETNSKDINVSNFKHSNSDIVSDFGIRVSDLVAFLSSLFYVFNLSTVQQFYAPFEMFPTQYAFLPWILLYSLKVLYNPSKKSLLLFSFITLFSTPQAYAAHFWYVFFGTYISFLLLFSLLAKTNWKRPLTLIILTLLINSFWLLPNLYFITTTSFVPKESKQNRIYSQEYRLRNREHGYLKDVALMKGFYFSWSAYNFQSESFEYLMPAWKKHMENPIIAPLGYLFFVGVLAGMWLAIRKRNILYLAFLPFFIVPFIFLMNHTFPFDILFDYFSRIPLFEESLRFVFTKFSILLLFAYTLYLSVGLYKLFTRLSRNKKYLVTVSIVALLMVYSFPLFKGELISSKFKIRVPNEYFELWNFMNSQDRGTILTFPLHTFSGWQYYDWGYQGAGFIWFGMKQPILDRDFDRWNISNEKSFREFQYALYAKSPALFAKTIGKYNIRYLVWDKSNVSVGAKNRTQILFIRETQELLTTLSANKLISKEKEFGSIVVYKVARTGTLAGTKKLPTVSPDYRWNFQDKAFSLLGTYTSGDSYQFPFRNIVTETDRIQKNLLSVDSSTNSYFLTTGSLQRGQIAIPEVISTEEVLFTDLYVNNLGNSYELLFRPVLPKGFVDDISYIIPVSQRIRVNGQEYQLDNVFLDTATSLYLGQSYLYTKEKNVINGNPVTLSFGSRKEPRNNTALFGKFPLAKIQIDKQQLKDLIGNKPGLSYDSEKNTVTFTSRNHQVGIAITLANLPHSTGYIVGLRAQNHEGLPLRVCLKNLYSGICTVYDEISKTSGGLADDYFVVPPLENGLGYALSIDNISYGDYESKNELQSAVIMPFPYEFLSSIYVKKPGAEKVAKQVIVFPSSYHEGWKAYANGEELKNHILVNNWANGWLLKEQKSNGKAQRVTLVFWPQYLEYLGFGLLLLAFILITCYTMEHRKTT